MGPPGPEGPMGPMGPEGMPGRPGLPGEISRAWKSLIIGAYVLIVFLGWLMVAGGFKDIARIIVP